ncbi:MAG: hypothetical protein FWC50_02470 [Planctomycetaceae bacterium]|nr:hypothetical protein [Planctomycetaceae bacterium]
MTLLMPAHTKKKQVLLLTLVSVVIFGISAAHSCLAADESNEILSFGYFPATEYEKLTKIADQGEYKEWATSVQKNLVQFFQQMEHSPQDTQESLEALRHLVCGMKLSPCKPLEEDGITFTVQDVVENIKRRIPLWEKTVEILKDSEQTATLGCFPQKNWTDVITLQQKSDLLRNNFIKSSNGMVWLQYFKFPPLYSQLGRLTAFQNGVSAKPEESYANLVSQETDSSQNPSNDETSVGETVTGETAGDAGQSLSEEEIRTVSLIANQILAAQAYTTLTAEQSQVLAKPEVREWLSELKTWQSNPVHPFDILAAYEYFSTHRGMSEGVQLSTCARQMGDSKSLACRQLGLLVQNQFSHAHLKIYISKYLINMMLPIRDPEFDVVRDVIAGQQVTGRRRTDTQVQISLVPDPNRLLMTLQINGRIVADTTSATFPATVHNQSRNTYSAVKPLELTSKGILIGQAGVSASSDVKLRNLETEFDVVPIFGDLVREIAKNQYQNQKSQIQSEAKAKVLAQAKQRIDSEADARFAQFNDRMDRLFLSVIKKRGASLEQYESKTTEDWLMTSWYLSTQSSLGSDSPEPLTPQGAIADLKVHECGLNAALERLELAGKQMTVGELKHYLTDVIGRPDLGTQEEENDGVVIGFADENPLGIRFDTNRVELSLHLKHLQVENQSWDDFLVTVTYVPGNDANGSPCLMRDGTVQLAGQLGLREQIPLRAIFSKIFPNNQPVPLKPRIFSEDERFAGLNTGYVRIGNGWFAIALVPQATVAIHPTSTIVRNSIIRDSAARGSIVRDSVIRDNAIRGASALRPGVIRR